MKTQATLLAAALAVLAAPSSTFAAQRFVDVNNASSIAPYTNWATAATVIQDAVDAAEPGDEILVTNGVYATGGRAMGTNSLVNRVAIDKAVTVRSVNGPEFTRIQGSKAAGGGPGVGAIRCVYLANGASLCGFTLTNGATLSSGTSADTGGGGVWCQSVGATVTNCLIIANSAIRAGGGTCGGALYNCTLRSNSTPNGGTGGGAYESTLTGCTLAWNSAQGGGGAASSVLTNCTVATNWVVPYGNYYTSARGGGASDSTLINCTLIGNSSAGYGGGAYGGTLTGCVLTNNSAQYYGGGTSLSTLMNCVLIANHAGWYDDWGGDGGGAYWGTLRNCILTDNVAAYGGGTYGNTTLKNCALTSNRARYHGGGAYGGTLVNCTLTGNSARWAGGGVCANDYPCQLTNCIVYGNTALSGANYSEQYELCTFDRCCTSPLPNGGAGNFDIDPQLASATHLGANSPCIGRGSYASATGLDIDGEAWANPPSVGCDEYISGSVVGELGVAITADYTNVAAGFGVQFQALITGRVSASFWNFGDGTVVSNAPYPVHSWGAVGEYPVVLSAFNESNPGGVTATTLVHVVTPPVHYVAPGSPGPAAPYTSWETAATNVQDAVNVASVPGALVLVTNGSYEPVTIDTPLTLQSVNGPEVTVIRGSGQWSVGTQYASRCVSLSQRASIVGFTLTEGATANDIFNAETRQGGGICCASASEVVSNCVITGNAARFGGGACGGTLKHCILTNNLVTASDDLDAAGGAAYYSTLVNCVVSANAVETYYYNGVGGGAYRCFLDNCLLTHNWAYGGGGGAYWSTLNNCTLNANSSGASLSYLRNCALYDNGGGADGGSLINCTIVHNSYGVVDAFLQNCIVWDNTAEGMSNWYGGILEYCCTTPQPTEGIGNITADPQLADPAHLSAGSPCRRAGSAAYANGVDIDREPWAGPPSMGCDEYYSGSATGALSLTLSADLTNVIPGFPVSITGQIFGHASANAWDFGDGTVQSNRLAVSPHSWSQFGTYPVVLRAWNGTYPDGVSTTVMVHVAESKYYVAAANPNPLAPYTSWATAATNIQDAVDAAAAGSEVIVSNGVYRFGSRESYNATNRVLVDRPMSLRSVNGPQVTVICGSTNPAVRCVYLGAVANLSGFTLTGGLTTDRGGGVAGWGRLSDCIISGNSAQSGGGVDGCSLRNCVVSGNYASWQGGGACGATLNNCTIVGNRSAQYGGGTEVGTMNNCVIYYNSAPIGQNYQGGTLSNCCTRGDYDSITNAPLFIDLAGGNLRLQSNSPCVNAGNNAYVFSDTDLDGRPRIVGGAVDIGAYEFQGPGMGEFSAWLQEYGLATDGSADYVDTEADGHNNWQEWLAGTDPTNVASVLRLDPPVVAPGGMQLRWSSDASQGYFVQRATNLAGPLSFTLLRADIPGLSGTTAYTDSAAPGLGQAYYRVGTGVSNWASPPLLQAPVRVPASITLTWSSVTNRVYTLERATNLGAVPVFSVLRSNIAGLPGTTSWTDTNALGDAPRFYRIRLQ